jgi:hypothetical protein
VTEWLDAIAGSKAIEFQQETEPANDCADVKAQGMVDEAFNVELPSSHPEPFGNLRNATYIGRMTDAIDDGAFGVADGDGLLLGHPDLRYPEKLLRRNLYEAVRVTSDRLRADATLR